MIVTCNECKTGIYKLVGYIFPTKQILSADFEGINGYPNPAPGDLTVCPGCGKDLGETFRKLVRSLPRNGNGEVL